MSSHKRKKVTMETIQEENVAADIKKRSLQSSIFDINQNDPFMGGIMQCLDIHYTHQVPRAGIMFDQEGRKWNMAINPYWFCMKVKEHKTRKAVLIHEISHITHKHPMRAPFIKLHPKRRAMMNVAMDLSINQKIQHLPDGCSQCPSDEEAMTGAECKNKMCPGKCCLIENYYDEAKYGKKIYWPRDKPFEDYYQRLIQRYVDSDDPDDGDGEGGESGSGDGMPREFDSHDWESSAEESDMLDATEELVKRAMQKRGLTMSTIPGYAKSLLDEIEARRNEIDVKKIVHSAIKRRASGYNREKSWTRRSRRYGLRAPGTKNGKLPHLEMYEDTSGSISTQELNDNRSIIDDFLQAGSRKCGVNLWHTKVYYSGKYKLGDRLEDKDVYQSGGTDLGPTLQHIADTMPDLAIIYTDGCYCDVDYESMTKFGIPFPQTLFIISRDGKADHPLLRLGETVKIPNSEFTLNDRNLED